MFELRSVGEISQFFTQNPTSAVKLTELSMNGTFINGKIFERGECKDLEDIDLIAVGKCQFKVYYYKISFSK
jgi:hypothetical protein